MESKYRDLAGSLSEVRARTGGATSTKLTAPEWASLALRIDGLRTDLESIDRSLGGEIADRAAARGLDPAASRISDLADPSEAEAVRAAAVTLREAATVAREAAAANARYFSERIAVVEATIQVLADAQRGPAYGPKGASPAGETKGFFEGRA